MLMKLFFMSPVKILMTKTRTVESDDISHIHFRLRLNSYSKFELDGVSIEEEMRNIKNNRFGTSCGGFVAKHMSYEINLESNGLIVSSVLA